MGFQVRLKNKKVPLYYFNLIEKKTLQAKLRVLLRRVPLFLRKLGYHDLVEVLDSALDDESAADQSVTSR